MKQDNWNIFGAYASLCFGESKRGENETHKFVREIESIPGIKKDRGAYLVPKNSIDIVVSLAKKLDVPSVRASWVRKEDAANWEDIKQNLLKGGMKAEYIENWPLPFQKEALCFGWDKGGVAYWHVTGAGKTFTGIAATYACPGNVLVITRSAAKLQLAREIERFTGCPAFVLRPKSYTRTKKYRNGKTWHQFVAEKMPEFGKMKEVAEEWKRWEQIYGEREVIVTPTLKEYIAKCVQENTRPFVVVSWEALTRHKEDIEYLKPKVAVFDEIHMGKSAKRWDRTVLPALPADARQAAAKWGEYTKFAKQKGGFLKKQTKGGEDIPLMFTPVESRASYAALIARNVEKRIGLTATPIANLLRDLWAQLDILEPNAHGNKTSWLKRYCDLKPGKYGGMDDTGKSNVEELKKRIDRVAHKVPMEVAQGHLMHLKRRKSVYLAEEDLCNVLPGFGRKKNFEHGSSRLEHLLMKTASRKRKALVEIVTDDINAGLKVCIFTGRREDCNKLVEDCEKSLKKNKKASIWRIHGDVPLEERQEIIDDYMAASDSCLLVATLQAMGQSINLHDTDMVYYAMLPLTPEVLRQSEGRFFRLGMKRSVIIHYVIAENTIDEHMADLLINKLPTVVDIAEDIELGSATEALSALDGRTEEEFVSSVLASLDEDFDD